MKILVTGGTGFTGGHLAAALQKQSHAVRVLARPGADVRQLRESGVEIVEGDLLSADDVQRAVDGMQQLHHIAASYRSAGHQDDHFWKVNVQGTRNILEAAKRHCVERVIHCSTIGVHGDVGSGIADEQWPFRPGDVYQRTKLEGELLAQEAFQNGLPGVIVRPTAIYGPGDTRFLKLFRSIHGRTFRMFGTGEISYHLVYIDDLVDGIIRCAEHPKAVGNIYILGGQRSVTLNELTRLVASAVEVPSPQGRLPLWPLRTVARLCESICRPWGIEPPLHRRRVEFFVKHRCFSIQKARSELGYEPQVDLSDGLCTTARWYFANGLLTNHAGNSRRSSHTHKPLCEARTSS